MSNEEIIEKAAFLVASSPDVLDKIKLAVEASLQSELATKANALPTIDLTDDEFSALEEYVKAGSAFKEPFKLIELIENGFEQKQKHVVLVGLCNVYALLRQNFVPIMETKKKEKKVAELQKLSKDILSGKVPV